MRLRNFIHLDEILNSSKPLTGFVRLRLISKRNLPEKIACRYFFFLKFKSKKLMDKAKLLESKVKPEERASIQ